MSTERNPIVSSNNTDISVTTFSGGAARGPCIQLGQNRKDGRNIGHQTVQVDLDQAYAMRDMLDKFIQEKEQQSSKAVNFFKSL